MVQWLYPSLVVCSYTFTYHLSTTFRHLLRASRHQGIKTSRHQDIKTSRHQDPARHRFPQAHQWSKRGVAPSSSPSSIMVNGITGQCFIANGHWSMVNIQARRRILKLLVLRHRKHQWSNLPYVLTSRSHLFDSTSCRLTHHPQSNTSIIYPFSPVKIIQKSIKRDIKSPRANMEKININIKIQIKNHPKVRAPTVDPTRITSGITYLRPRLLCSLG